MKKRKSLWMLSAIAVLFLALSLPVSAREGDQVIAEGIFAGEVDLGGLTREEAGQAIQSYVEGLGRQTLTVKTDIYEDKISLKELGLCWDNEAVVDEAAAYGKTGNLLVRYKALERLNYERQVYDLGLSFDYGKISAFAEEKLSAYNSEPVEPTLVRENGAFTVEGGTNGVKVDLPATIQKMKETVNAWNGGDLTVETVAEITSPQQDAEALRAVQDALGTYSTSYAVGNVGRSKSLELSAQRLNGTLVYPGETISVSTLMGPRTIAGGYGVAGAYIDSTVTDSVGAGICQTASTLYAAALYAELNVTERYNHSMTVNYMPAALDATIYAGSSYTNPQKDLKLKNDYQYPVYIEAIASGGKLTFTIYGKEERPASRKVSYVSHVISETWPTEITWTDDPNLPLGHQVRTQGAYAGVKASLTKVVTENGVETERTLLHTDRYKMVNEKWTRGTNPGLTFDEAGNVVPVPQMPAEGDAGQPQEGEQPPEQQGDGMQQGDGAEQNGQA